MSKTKRRAAAFATAVLSIVAALVLTAPAGAAATAVTVRSIDVIVPGDSEWNRDVPAGMHDYYAPCAPGEKVVHGGWWMSNDGFYPYVVSFDSNPATTPGTTQDAWHMRLSSFGGPTPVRIFAVCASGEFADGLTVRTTNGHIDPNIYRPQLFYGGCAPGEKAVGGGWQALDQPGPWSPNVFPEEDHPTGTENFGVETWAVGLSNYGETEARINVYAVCANGAAASKVTMRAAYGDIDARDYQGKHYYAGCLPGEKVLSGGWWSPLAPLGWIGPGSEGPIDSQNFGVEAWRVELYSYGLATPLTVYALCLSA